MRFLARIALPLVLLATVTTLAFAAPLPSTTPYPAVPANPDVCKVEKLEVEKAQLAYDLAKRMYDRTKAAYDRGAASPAELRAAERAVHLAAIALNNAKYAEATCRNKQGNDPKKECLELSLELNRLMDELALRQELERLARADYDAALAAGSAVSQAELDTLETAWRTAVLERRIVEQKIADLKAKIAANPACKDYPSTRPTTAPTTPTSTPPTTTPPTTTPPTTGPGTTQPTPTPGTLTNTVITGA